MKEFMVSASAKAALCVAIAGLLLVWPNSLAWFLASILISYAVVLVRRALRQANGAATRLARVFAEVANHDDPRT
jgi:hypothetical protein